VTTMTLAGHGPNIGHGYVKYIIIDEHGVELPPIVFPAQIARAGRAVAGSLATTATVELGDERYWVGDDAQLAPSPTTILAQQRLRDPLFIPVLLRGALGRFGSLNGASTGVCVTGLPASWAEDASLARLLGDRLRMATSAYRAIKVIAEPLGLIYSVLLNGDGQISGDQGLTTGQIGVVDLGHLTVDVAIVQRLAPVPSSLDTWQLGTARPLSAIRSRLSAAFDRELTLRETDQAVRAGQLRTAGQDRALPAHWDAPLVENGHAIGARLQEAWGSGSQLDTILIGGGGAELAPLVEAIVQRFPHARCVADPQLAIARGYARLARRLGAS